MFKRLFIVTLTLSGLLLAGCANQQSEDLKTSDKTEQTKTTSNTPKKSPKTTKSKQSTEETTASQENNSTSDATKTQQDQATDQTTDENQNQTDNQTDQTQQSVSLTTAQAAVEFLADKLSTTYDKTTTQYVANGKITWNDVSGYQINIYSKNSDSPVGSYLVPEDGQYFQIW